ncbi:uncharacterized protein [Coffea arabica]|uniref:RNase H type-1 domain-containing protein n=1 Tax=Coffea arabica TaxID=13443 RepID=A0ABM4U4U3_COFAR
MIDATTEHEVLSFMDGSFGYNQIRLAPEDEELTAFRTPKGCERTSSGRFFVDHPIPAEWELSGDLPDENVLLVEIRPPWKMYFDGAAHRHGVGAGIIFVTPNGGILLYSFTLNQYCSNNVTEYQALILGLEIAVDMEQLDIQIYGDSQLVVNQLLGSYEVKKSELISYHKYAT